MKRFSHHLGFTVLLLGFYALGWGSAHYLDASTSPDRKTPVTPGFELFSFASGTMTERADMDLFWEIWDRLDKNYVEKGKLDKKEMVYGAVKGMVSSIGDPYTVFMTPQETTEFLQSLDGKLEGIGAELTVEDQNLVVVSPVKNSPAERAGLLPGDIIYKVEGELSSEMTLFEAISNIRGPKGTEVTLTIIRKSEKDPFDVKITRDSITIESVEYEEKGDIAYISISQFNDSTKPEFNSLIPKLLVKQPKGIVLDLRFNGGGYLDIAVDLLGELVEGKKKVVSIKRRSTSDDESISLEGRGRLKDIPLVVLVNEGSASASEIVAGAIQDLKRGIVIGTQTFGKGSVQEVLDDFKDGSSLRMTIAKWLTPAGRDIEEVGIEPDRIVEISEEDLKNDTDSQLDAAVEYLKGL